MSGGNPIRKAVRALVVDDDWSTLLVRLQFPTWAGWVLPGGGIDEGEFVDHDGVLAPSRLPALVARLREEGEPATVIDVGV